MPFDDPLNDLHNYNSEMTISQVVKFFKRKGISFTNTMIQNYVRVGVLSSPDGRVYRKEHMKTLVMIEYLKPVLSLEEIRGLFEAINVSECYYKFMEAHASASESWANRCAGEAPEDILPELAAACAAAKETLINSKLDSQTAE